MSDPREYDDHHDDYCGNCGGEGYTYNCIDGCCVNAEDGCELCASRCDWCAPPLPRRQRMAEPDRTNADAERVSDIVAPAECKCDDPNCGFNHKPLTLRRAYENCLVRLRGSEGIIEAQSKALAEARVGNSADDIMDQAREKRRHAAALITDAEVLEQLAYDAADYCGGGEP